MKFHQAVAHALADHGVDLVFGVMGDGNLFMMQSFAELDGTQFVSTTHEAGAVLAANGYAHTSGRLGVASVTHGPGLTNTVTALVEGVKDRTPMLLVAGDTRTGMREHLQYIGQRPVVESAGAGFVQVRGAGTLAEDLGDAVRRAWTERRPVVLNVPVELQWVDVERPSVTPVVDPRSQAVAPDPEALDVALGIIASAKRPVVLAGRGAAGPRARAALIALAGRLGAPVATTLRGKDLFADQAHDLGVFGTLSHEVATEVIDASDCVIAFGASLNRWTTAEGALVRGKAVVHVDRDPASLGRWTEAAAQVLGDAASVAEAMVALLDEAEVPPTGFVTPSLLERLAAHDPHDHVDQSTGTTVDVRTAMARIDMGFPADRTLVVDCGRFVFSAFTAVRVPHPSAYLHTINFGSIGLGMGTALGAAYATPDRPVLLLVGDGGFMLGGLTEFNAAARHGADIVVVVLNDGAYGAEHIQFTDREVDPTLSTFEWPDLAGLGRALGGEGLTVTNLDELDAALATLAARERTGPVLVDVRLDPWQVPSGAH